MTIGTRRVEIICGHYRSIQYLNHNLRCDIIGIFKCQKGNWEYEETMGSVCVAIITGSSGQGSGKVVCVLYPNEIR